jgi:hypothetical protein
MNAQQVNVLTINEPTVFCFRQFDAQFAHVITTTGNGGCTFHQVDVRRRRRPGKVPFSFNFVTLLVKFLF